MSRSDLIGLLSLVVFAVAASVGGFLISPVVGLFCLAGAALVTALLMGWSS